LRIVTSAGTVEARAVIVTAPPSILASEALRFVPPLDDTLQAAASLPLGLADKIFLHVDGAEELDPDSHLLGNPHRSETGSYYLRPFGRPIIEVFLGGSTAWLLEAEGPRGAISFAMDELAELFGSAMRRRVHPLAASAWGQTDWINGSYSHALPGEAAARAALARPVEDRIFFAGEACSFNDFSTTHGAHQTGCDAAEAAIGALGRA
jgi:monoamine oxidase